MLTNSAHLTKIKVSKYCRNLLCERKASLYNILYDLSGSNPLNYTSLLFTFTKSGFLE